MLRCITTAVCWIFYVFAITSLNKTPKTSVNQPEILMLSLCLNAVTSNFPVLQLQASLSVITSSVMARLSSHFLL